MATINLTELQYSTDRKGPFALYVYGRDGYHSGKQWFRDKPIYPDEEITTSQAHNRAFSACAKGQEVRICDGGDNLVFHAVGEQVLYGENFWKELKTPEPEISHDGSTIDKAVEQVKLAEKRSQQ